LLLLLLLNNSLLFFIGDCALQLAIMSSASYHRYQTKHSVHVTLPNVDDNHNHNAHTIVVNHNTNTKNSTNNDDDEGIIEVDDDENNSNRNVLDRSFRVPLTAAAAALATGFPTATITTTTNSTMISQPLSSLLDTTSEEIANNDCNNDKLAAVPRWLRLDPGTSSQNGQDRPLPLEATGLSLDIFARATILMSSLFLGPALLQLAAQACAEKDTAAAAAAVQPQQQYNSNSNNDESLNQNIATADECRIHGFRPSSILTNIAIVSGLLVSLLLPVFGAIVDHTPYRRQVGAITAAGLVLVKGMEIMVGPHTWLFVAALQVVSSVLYNPHITATYAYTCELSHHPLELTQYNTQLIVIMYVSTILFLIEVLGLSALLPMANNNHNNNNVGTARISQILTTVTSAVFFYWTWRHLFRDRPALSKVPPGQSVWTCGFAKVWDTWNRIRRHYRSLKWFMLSILLAEAGQSALITVATTFMTQVLQMSANEIGLTFLLVLLAGIPGSYLGAWLAVRFGNPLTSAKLCDLFVTLVTTVAAVSLTRPEQKHWIYVLGPLWGIGLGWLPPIHTSIFMSIIPKGQQAELMGMYLLCGQLLAWLPPLLFTMLNEMGVDMAWGMSSLNLFFGGGLVFLFAMGDYQHAVAAVHHVPLTTAAAAMNGGGVELETPPPQQQLQHLVMT